MSNMKKRIVGLLLAVLMAASACPCVFAEEAPPEEESAAAAEPAEEEPHNPLIIEDPPVIERNYTPVISFSDVPDSHIVSLKVFAPADHPLADGDILAYQINDEDWHRYVTAVDITQNCTFRAKIIFADGVHSPETSVTIDDIDNTAPTAPKITADASTWVKDKLKVEIAHGTDADSGYLRTEYRINDGKWTEYVGPFEVYNACTVMARGLDNAGNYSETASIKLNNFDVKAPDMSAASLVLSSTSGYAASQSTTFSKYFKGDVSVSIKGVRDDESGIAYYEYQTAGSTSNLKDDGWKRCDPGESPAVKGDFCGYVFLRAVDKVGNVSSNVISEGFIIDISAPVISDIVLDPSNMTEGKVNIKFSVTDNSQIASVTVNDIYVGTSSGTHAVYRNGEYVIRAIDAAGNVASQNVTVSNINTTPFALVNTFNNLNENNFTPSSWNAAKSAATELQGLLTAGSSEAKISAAYEKLLAAMETLVPKGDGTSAIALIERIKIDYSQDTYTDSSWALLENQMAAMLTLLDNPERTQEQVDEQRKLLETALTDLVPRGSFDALDNAIEKCEAIDASQYDRTMYNAMQDALRQAKELSRTDSSQEQIDSVYNYLLNTMTAMKDAPAQKKSNFTLIFFVILALLIIAAGTGLYIVYTRRKNMLSADQKSEDDEEGSDDEDDEEPDEEEYDGYDEADDPMSQFVFSDEDDNGREDDMDKTQIFSAAETGYIGGKQHQPRQRPGAAQRPNAEQRPNTAQRPYAGQRPNAEQRPYAEQRPRTEQRPRYETIGFDAEPDETQSFGAPQGYGTMQTYGEPVDNVINEVEENSEVDMIPNALPQSSSQNGSQNGYVGGRRRR